MRVYFDVLALGKGGGEQVLVLFVCAGLNFCHTNLGYWAESAAPLSYNLSLNLKDSSGRQGTGDTVRDRLLVGPYWCSVVT